MDRSRKLLHSSQAFSGIREWILSMNLGCVIHLSMPSGTWRVLWTEAMLGSMSKRHRRRLWRRCGRKYHVCCIGMVRLDYIISSESLKEKAHPGRADLVVRGRGVTIGTYLTAGPIERFDWYMSSISIQGHSAHHIISKNYLCTFTAYLVCTFGTDYYILINPIVLANIFLIRSSVHESRRSIHDLCIIL